MEISEDVKKLVIARLETMPANLKMSIGGDEDLDKHKMIKEVEKESDVGKKIVEMHMLYLRSFKTKM